MTSVRTRLTVSLVLLAGLVSLLGVFFGLRLLESQVRADGLDQIVEASVDPVTGLTWAEISWDQLPPFGTALEAGEFEGDFFEPALGGLSEEDLEYLSEQAMEEELEDIFGDDVYFQLLTGDLADINEDASIVELGDIAPVDGVLFAHERTDLLRAFDYEAVFNSVLNEEQTRELAEAFGNDDEELVVHLRENVTARLSVVGGRQPVDLVGVTPLVETAGRTPILADSVFGFASINGDFTKQPTDDREYEFGTRIIANTEMGIAADVTERVAALDEVRDTLWAAAGLLTVLSGLGAWLITGRALRPVAGITDQVSRISSGSLGDRVPVPGRQDEIGRLALTMNAMLNRIELGDRTRRQFVSDASHELRTPVAVMQSEAEVALKAPETTSVPELAAVMQVESKRLGSMVEDLLSLARADETDNAARFQVVDVDELVLREVQRTRQRPVDVAGVSAGRIRGREGDVGRVITHLLDNAVRHATTRVQVSLQTRDNLVTLHVDDDGNGIAEHDRARVFERFVRLDEARNRDGGGAGLGLAVVRSTVESMNGTVEVSSAPLGGARFTVIWPAADPD